MLNLDTFYLLLLAASTLVGAKPLTGAEPTPTLGAAPNELIQISIGLEPESRDRFEQTLYDISNPKHRRHGKHLSRGDAKALLQPSRDSTGAVKRWLSKAGIPDSRISDQGQFIDVRLNIQQARTLLGARHHAIADSGEGGVQSTESSLPPELRSHVATIYRSLQGERTKTTRGLSHRQRHQAMGARHGHSHRSSLPIPDLVVAVNDDVDLEECKDELTPACLRKIYRVGNNYPEHHGKTSFAIPGFGGQAAQYDQLDKFLRAYAPYAVGANFSVESINGGQNTQGEVASGEANLDIQYAVAMVYNLPVRYLATGGGNRDIIPDLDMPTYLPQLSNATTEPFLEFARHLLDLDADQLPSVVSISYGINEQVLPKAYATQVCDMFGQLGARGVSIIVATGDMGPGQSCQSNDGKNTTKFLPIFPATCPYVTAVGATASNSPEVASEISSGGFSEYFARPSWQNETVGAYLCQHGDEWKGYYNPNGRAFPDVSALGTNYQIYSHNEIESTGGASASAPVFASLIALLNDERAKNNKPPLGFLNPWIYRVGDLAFTDITIGKSIGCQGRSTADLPSPIIPNAGWSAVPGWDPVTGLGTPRFDHLKRLSSG
ncbi:Tripeptidyl-peptidase SED2 [Cladobotryum mycophilum]|uniref:tripeptidyl-peptidase II n=1 Tax=Cladobotryum mycophilum TaxID=491253 RepID=A0ABR0SKG4_9HYPO